MNVNITLTRPLLRILQVCAVSLAAFAALSALLPWQKNTGLEPGTDLPHYSMPWIQDNPFYPAELKTEGNRLVDWRGLPSATFCAECHLKEFKEWASSIHAVSGLDVIYETSVAVNEFGSREGGELATEKARWCESCHEPLAVMAGATTPLPVVGPNPALEEGATCIACHVVRATEPLAGNGALTLAINEIHRYLDPALVMAAPQEHAKAMQAKTHNPLMGRSEMCGACHTEIRPSPVHGDFPLHMQETFDEWRLSPYAAQGIECQDCHMHPDPAAYIAALKRGEKPERPVSHRFVGNNYLLTAADLLGRKVVELRGGWVPGRNVFLSGEEWLADLQRQHELILGLLEEAADLAIETRRASGAALELDLVVTNSGAGHNLPTGPLDQRHMWLQLSLEDAQGRVLYDNGWFDGKTGEIDPDAVLYIKRMTNGDGSANTRHVLFDVDRMAYARPPIRPAESDRVGYRIPLPAGVQGPLRVKARLWYRLALQDILQNIEEYQIPALNFDVGQVVIPPVLMAETTMEVEAGSESMALAGGR
ncbi:MAG: multiheme c-type cytochrome [Gammaproteobacteria bacterium]|nr:multiheme c-type cytochrome [Gammaproteobacteria bacterium]